MNVRTRGFLALLTGCAFLFASNTTEAQPKKSKPATQADIERLEKKIEDQQKTIEKLVRLQRQYMASLEAIFDGASAPATNPVSTAPATTPAPTPSPSPAPAPTVAAMVDKKSDVKPAVSVNAARDPKPAKPTKEPAATGAGTVVGKVSGGAGAIVYVEDIVQTARGTATMKQEGKQFLPQVLVVQKGTKVDFPNRDAIFHNVFSVTPDNTFDLGSYRQGESKSVTMSKPGVVTVYCNMHPQMVGHILVVPNGNYVRAGNDGFFRLTNVPAGPHRIVAWAPNSKPVVVSTTVNDGEVATVEMKLVRGRGATHTKKDGMPYGSYDK